MTSYIHGVSETLRFPDFFIVGAPRCGTTALTGWLKHHPEICFSKPKEPHFFTKVEPLLPSPDLRADYLEPYFWHYDPERHRAVGEGSVSTLYSPEAVQRILTLNPAAKFIVLVRNPLEMLPSYHQLMLYYLEEEVEDFATAWRLQAERARGERLPRRCLDPRLLQYADAASLGQHVGELMRLAGREQCLVLTHDELSADPGGTRRRVLAFLGVEDEGFDDFRPRNESRHYRSAWLHRLIYRPPLVKPAKLVTFVAGRNRKRGRTFVKKWRKRVLRWNTVPRSPVPLSPELRAELHATFEKDVDRLGQLLGRDLGHWR